MPSSLEAKLIIADSESDSNLYYACQFLVPDPIIYFEWKNKKYLILSDLEIDRAKKQAQADYFLSLTAISKKVTRSKKERNLPAYALIVHKIFGQKKIKRLVVPANFPAQYYVAFKKLGYSITVKPDPFYENRLIKTPEQKKYIIHAAKHVAGALQKAVLLLEKSKIVKNRIYYGKEMVTSELLRSVINADLMRNGCVAMHTIVASGVQGSFPHHEGNGPIIPHTPIIFDIFPRDAHSRYWADQTRTFIKGNPSAMVRKMYDSVLKANQLGISLVKEGVSGAEIHKQVKECMEADGFKTGVNKGRLEGYIHSTGHGLGLDIHELPSVSAKGGVLHRGEVITIEPGLYYQAHGGIRVEDDVFVTKNGREVLTCSPKFFEIDRGV
ncbi:MAG: hypothetical protein ACD_73C00321G0006 [uncultured bacterium]|nr:MAG: hypothetical protein ACD_73C00321G0006 [uncultured bacterium]